jgi:hypothetical protein
MIQFTFRLKNEVDAKIEQIERSEISGKKNVYIPHTVLQVIRVICRKRIVLIKVKIEWAIKLQLLPFVYCHKS